VSDGGQAVSAAEHAEEPIAVDAAAVDGTEADTEGGAPRPEGTEAGEGRRRGRGRDRNRRERSPETEADAADGLTQGGALATAAFHEAEFAAPLAAEAVEPVAVAPVSVEAPPAEAEVAPAPVAYVAPVAAPAPISAPAAVVAAPVQAFVLPTDSLQAVAEAAGLQWVNSDADKVRAVQAAMASEPAPVHVPRERPPLKVVDEGPLVLVETRKDLAQIKLPFETAQGSQPQA
jgi:ribonuclease E